MKCRIKKHMTVSKLQGVDTLIFNYSCMPHGVRRKAFRTPEGREGDIDLHKAERKAAKKKQKSSDLP